MVKNNEAINEFEAHVRFELDSLQGEGLRQTIHEEVTALFEFFGEKCLDDFTSAEMIIDFFQRNVIERPIPDEIPDFIAECANKIQECFYNDDTILEEVISKELYDEFVQNILGMEDLRNEVINHVVSSTIFSMLITETLYGGIKAFAVSENLIMKKVPGASSLMNVGKGLLNKTTFGLSDNIAGHIDVQIKKFVSTNIENHLQKSEQFLIDAFDEEMIIKSGEEIWLKAGKYDSHDLAGFIDKGHIDSIAQNVRDFWSDFRQTDIFSKISKTLIEYFFQKYGEKLISHLLEDIGITSEMIINELEKTALPVLENEIVQSYLEERVRDRLQRYYNTRELTEDTDSSGKTATGDTDGGKTEKISDMDSVYGLIEKSDKGIDTKTLKIKTGLETKTIQTIIGKLKKQGKITSAIRGVYIMAGQTLEETV